MTSLNDVPLVGNAVNRIEDAAIDSAILKLRYLLCYKSLIKVLKSHVDKLIIEEDAISRKAVAERDDGKILEEHVLRWQQDVENIKEVVGNLFERYEQRPSWMCFKDIPFAKPVSRFRLGKQAAEHAKTVIELTDSGKEFRANEIAHHPPNENVPISDTPYQSFQSRQEAYRKLWEALVNEDGCPILGIYGMPGVGKTRMMEQAWQEAKEKGFFRKVTRANIGGEKVDVINIQKQLAGYLGCHLESKDNMEHRASQLKNSLMNGGKTLVILDDVWDVIPLNKIGIPFGHAGSRGCKVLLTSRKRDICLANNCEYPIEIKTLTEGEAWSMFENAVGNSKIESLRETSLAEKVCRKCGRLPLLISAVGKALRFMTENSWKDALSQLENCRYEEIAGMEPGVYSCLLLSFEKLTEAGKACLLLCSLYPEDADISIKDLSDLAMWSQFLDRQRNIAGVVDILKSSSLLLQGKDDVTVKLHDTIRDVVRAIAAKDPKYAFIYINCRLGWPDYAGYHTLRVLHLDLHEENVCFPNDLVCPDLQFLLLQGNHNQSQNLSSSFFEGLTNLRFKLQRMDYPEQQLSIHRLENLRMIILHGFVIDETFFHCVSPNLEILSIQDCALPCPLDLSNIKNLKLLEIKLSNKIVIVPKSISSLWSLEELSIPSGFTIWEDADADCAIYAEVNKLTRLRNLIISLPYFQSCLDGEIMSNLQEFNISVGYCDPDPDLFDLSIGFRGNHIETGWMPLIERAEKVYIHDCAEIDLLGSLSAHFSNLCFLTINNCQGLKYLFPDGVAKCLQKIQKLEVCKCDAIEEIVRVDCGTTGRGEVIVNFPKLKELQMEDLPNLKSFSTHKVAFPSLEELYIIKLSKASEIWENGIYNQEASSSFSQLKVLIVRECEKMEKVIPVTLVHEFNKLEHVLINSCNSLKTVFQGSSIASDKETDGRRVVFSSMKTLQLEYLPNIESFWSYDGEPCKVSFPNLEDLRPWWCGTSGLTEQIELGRDDDSPSKLITFMASDLDEVEFLGSQWPLQLQNLRCLVLQDCMWHGHSLFNTITPTLNTLIDLQLDNCGLGPTLFTTSCFSSFQQLQYLTVKSCDLLEEIVEEDDDTGMDDEKTISLPSLYLLELDNLPSLKSFSQSSSYAFSMPALKSVSLATCPHMKKFTSFPVNAPLLETINGQVVLEEDTSDLNSYVSQQVYGKD